MTTKDNLANEILLKMQHHLDQTGMAILQNVLAESLYDVDVSEKKSNMLSTEIDSNNYILDLFQLKRSVKLSHRTIEQYLITARELIRYVDIPLVNMTTEDIEHYLAIKKRQGCLNTTLNNKIRNLSSLFEFMRKSHFIVDNPVDGIENFKEVKKPVDYLDVVSFDQLRNACQDLRDRALIEWLRSTAIRVGEISNVSINQINWGTGEVIIYGEKTSTYRTVFVDELARIYLKRYIFEQRGLDLASSLPLFAYLRGDKTKALSDKGIQAEIRRIGKRSGLDRRIYPHLFRKTTATNVVMRGGTIDEAGIYLGHVSTGVTAKYYVGTQEDTVKYIYDKYVKAI